MAKFDELGINPKRDENSIIVSLTSFPERMADIHYCLYSLLYETNTFCQDVYETAVNMFHIC